METSAALTSASFTPRMQRLLSVAQYKAEATIGVPRIGTEHMLFALGGDPDASPVRCSTSLVFGDASLTASARSSVATDTGPQRASPLSDSQVGWLLAVVSGT